MALAFTSGGGGGGGGGSGTVTSVSSSNTAIAVATPTTTPALTLATLDVIAADGPPAANWSNNSKKITSLANGSGAQDAAAFGQIPTALPTTQSLDQIAAAHATAADWSNNSHKITGLTNGSAASDAAAFGQIPVALPPNGTAGGDLSGTYPNPAVKALTETSGPTDLVVGTVTDGQFLKRVAGTLVSGAPVASVAATDTSIVVAGTATAPTIATGTLDVIAADHAPAADWSNNSHKITSVAAATASTDALTFAASDKLYRRSPGGLVFSPLFPFIAGTAGVAGITNGLRFIRIEVPQTGTLHDISVLVLTSSGNVSLAVYDTGDATAGTLTRLATSGAVACGTGNAWQTYDPALSVTAGAQLLLAVTADNGTATFLGFSAPTNASTPLPANFVTTPAAAGYMFGQLAATNHPAPATFLASSIALSASSIAIIARIS